MMGFIKEYATGKVYIFEQENRGRKNLSPLTTFPVGKAIPDGLLPSRAHFRFTLPNKERLLNN